MERRKLSVSGQAMEATCGVESLPPVRQALEASGHRLAIVKSIQATPPAPSGSLESTAPAFRHEPVPEGEGSDYWAQEACRHLRYDAGADAVCWPPSRSVSPAPAALAEPPAPHLRKAPPTSATTLRGWTTPGMPPPGRGRAAAGLPLGSGVTEAGCKLLVKKRLCGPGMSWGFTMAGHLLSLRALAHSTGQRWQRLWKEIFTKPIILAIQKT